MANRIDVNGYRGVWVFVELRERRPIGVSIELLGKGRELADHLEVDLSAFVMGEKIEDLADELIQFGADEVILAEHPLLKDYRTETYCDVLARHVLESRPEVLLVGASPVGRDLAPRLAMRLNTGCTADCTELDIDKEARLFVSTRPAFGGNVMATILCPEHRPQMSTVRPGTMPAPEKDTSRKGRVTKRPVSLREEDIRVSVSETLKVRTEGVKIDEAERIVAVGKGVGDPECFGMVKELANALGAQVAATRLVVEEGWISHDRQVGQTGKTVRPTLYVACGISGAVQHTAGMTGSKIIVAINSDRRAQIFNVADYGIVGDVRKIVPAILAELNKT